MAFNLVLTKEGNRNTRQKAEVYKTPLQGLGFPLQHPSTAVANAVTAAAAARFSAENLALIKFSPLNIILVEPICELDRLFIWLVGLFHDSLAEPKWLTGIAEFASRVLQFLLFSGFASSFPHL